jgi:hypothetical protein
MGIANTPQSNLLAYRLIAWEYNYLICFTSFSLPVLSHILTTISASGLTLFTHHHSFSQHEANHATYARQSFFIRTLRPRAVMEELMIDPFHLDGSGFLYPLPPSGTAPPRAALYTRGRFSRHACTRLVHECRARSVSVCCMSFVT